VTQIFAITLFELITSQLSFHPTDCIAHEGNWCHILICALYSANPVNPVQEQVVWGSSLPLTLIVFGGYEQESKADLIII